MSRFIHRAALPLTLPLLLLACGQQQTTPAEDLGPYAGGAQYPWAYTAPTGRVAPLALTPGENNLFFEQILNAKNGWGPIEINRSNGEQGAGDGGPLRVGGYTYTLGYGVHAGSEMTFNLAGTGAACTDFRAWVGVDDEVGNRGSVVFQVFADGQKLYDSGVMTGVMGSKKVEVDLSGKQQLRLVVTDAGENNYWDHAVWGQPVITCVAGTPPDSTNNNDILFSDVAGPNEKYDLFTINPDGISERNLTNTPDASEQSLRQNRATFDWSPDRKRIVFIREGAVWTMNADGSDQKQLTASIPAVLIETTPTAQNAVWSPDGNYIAFTRYQDCCFESSERFESLFVMKSDGSDKRALLSVDNSADAVKSVTWSPDGTRLALEYQAYLGDRNSPRTSKIMVVNVTDSSKQVIASATTTKSSGVSINVVQDPAWSPDGRTVVYAEYGYNTSNTLGSLGNGGIIAFDLSSNSKRQLTPPTTNYEPEYASPLYSPDGSKIMYIECVKNGDLGYNIGCDENIFVMNADGSEIRQVTTKPENIYYYDHVTLRSPSWSPDGTRFAYTLTHRGTYGIEQYDGLYTIKLDGTDKRRISERVARNLVWR